METTFKTPLSGIVPPLVTPLADNETLDVESLERLIEHLIAGGVHGLFVLGTTGEEQSLSYAVRKQMIRESCRINHGRLPLLACITDTSIVESIKLAHVAADCGADGIIWPASVAPYHVDLLLLDPNSPEVVKAAEELESALEAQGIDVLLDDRAERPGVKFKDADLIGFPFRVVAGAKALAKGCFEVRARGDKESALMPVGDTAAWISARIKEKLAGA